MPFAGRNVASAVGKAIGAYNNAYVNYIIAKITYDAALIVTDIGYFIGENLLSDLISKLL